MWYAIAILIGLFREPTFETVSLGVGWSEVTALDDAFSRAARVIRAQCRGAGFVLDEFATLKFRDDKAWESWRSSGTADACRHELPPNQPQLHTLSRVFKAACVGVLARTPWNSGDIWGRHTMICTVTLHARCIFEIYDLGE